MSTNPPQWGAPGQPPSIPPPPPPASWANAPMVRDHPRAVTAMVLGILSLAVCQLCGPFALVIGRKAVREIDASGGAYGGRGQATAGWIMGLIATIFLVLGILFFLLVIILAIASDSTSTTTTVN